MVCVLAVWGISGFSTVQPYCLTASRAGVLECFPRAHARARFVSRCGRADHPAGLRNPPEPVVVFSHNRTTPGGRRPRGRRRGCARTLTTQHLGPWPRRPACAHWPPAQDPRQWFLQDSRGSLDRVRGIGASVREPEPRGPDRRGVPAYGAPYRPNLDNRIVAHLAGSVECRAILRCVDS